MFPGLQPHSREIHSWTNVIYTNLDLEKMVLTFWLVVHDSWNFSKGFFPNDLFLSTGATSIFIIFILKLKKRLNVTFRPAYTSHLINFWRCKKFKIPGSREFPHIDIDMKVEQDEFENSDYQRVVERLVQWLKKKRRHARYKSMSRNVARCFEINR